MPGKVEGLPPGQAEGGGEKGSAPKKSGAVTPSAPGVADTVVDVVAAATPLAP